MRKLHNTSAAIPIPTAAAKHPPGSDLKPRAGSDVTGGALKLYGEQASYGRIERELLGVPGVVCTGLVTQGVHTLVVADPQQGIQILDQASLFCMFMCHAPLLMQPDGIVAALMIDLPPF